MISGYWNEFGADSEYFAYFSGACQRVLLTTLGPFHGWWPLHYVQAMLGHSSVKQNVHIPERAGLAGWKIRCVATTNPGRLARLLQSTRRPPTCRPASKPLPDSALNSNIH